MPRTTQCTSCGVVLNLPDHAVGKRLKCPKCGMRFHAEDSRESSSSLEAGMPIASPDSSQDIPRTRGNASSIVPGIAKPGPDSSQEIPKGRSEEGLPVAAGDLRDLFDLPLMAGSSPGPSSMKPAADALALFGEKRPAPRRTTGAEARAEARRCPTCGGVVPSGMSLCSTCGLDLETGMRVALDDDLAPPPPPPSSGPPLVVAIIGGLCLLGSIAGTAVAAARWPVWHYQGWQWFIPIGLFAIYASVHFLQGKSAKLLLAALTLGILIDVVALIGLPIYTANVETTVTQVAPTEDPNAEGEAIQPITERLDTQKIGVGIGLLIGYAGIAAYLCSPPVHRFLKK